MLYMKLDKPLTLPSPEIIFGPPLSPPPGGSGLNPIQTVNVSPDAPPGSIWPPIDDENFKGKGVTLINIPGVGSRYVVVDGG
jgi:hypothetical protein